MRRAVGFLACVSVIVLAGCSWGGGVSEGTYTFSQREAGNIAASDGVGASLCQQSGVQTAFVAEEN